MISGNQQNSHVSLKILFNPACIWLDAFDSVTIGETCIYLALKSIPTVLNISVYFTENVNVDEDTGCIYAVGLFYFVDS